MISVHTPTMRGTIANELAARNLRQLVHNTGLLALGAFIFVYGMYAVMMPARIMTGGVVGVAMLAHYMIPDLSVGAMNLLFNVPLLALGLFSVGRTFMFYTFIGMGLFTTAAMVFHPAPLVITNPIMASLLAGVICGVGAGFMLRSLGSAGGMDIVGMFMNKHYGFRPGVVILASNALVIVAGIWFLGLEPALYSVLYVYVCGKVTDAVLIGANRKKSVLIISDRARDIAREMLKTRRHGVTFLKGEGAYTGNGKDIIMTVCPLTCLPGLKEQVFAVDENAFLVVNDTQEVVGAGLGVRKIF
ncbi:MAG: YitT family protein [Desulfatibacillaceae bacterium]